MKKVPTFLCLVLAASSLFMPAHSVSSEDWYEKGVHSLNSERYEEAIMAFSKAIEMNPKHADAYANRGGIWYYKEQYEKAIADYTKALAINPQSAEYYNNRGAAWFQLGAFSRAIEDFSSTLNIDRTYVNAYVNRGVALFQMGDHDKAIRDYNDALEIFPDNEVAYTNRGNAWFRKGHYDRAVSDYSKALYLNPRDADAYNQMARLLAVCPDETYRDGFRAVELAKKAVDLNPGPHTLDTLAAAYAEAGQFSDALKTQLRVIALKNKLGHSSGFGDSIERLKSYSAHKTWREKAQVPEKRKEEWPVVMDVKVSIANIRSRPSTTSSIIRKMKAGEKVTLLYRDNEWYAVKLPDNGLGWAHQSLFFRSD